MYHNGESFTLGPSADAWERHRAEITELYLKSSLSYMQTRMKEKHSFHASKRMFDARFKTWGVKKNLRRSEKERLSKSIDTVADKKCKKKVMRFLSAQRRLNRSRNGSYPVSESEASLSSGEQSLGWTELTSPPSNGGAIYEAESPRMTPVSGYSNLANHTSSSGSAGRKLTTSRFNTGSLSPPSGSAALLPATGAWMTDIATFTNPWFAIPRNIPSSKSGCNDELLLTIVGQYFASRLDTLAGRVVPEHVLEAGTTTLGKRFWNNVDTGIYLMKIDIHGSQAFPDTRNRAKTALEEATRLVDQLFGNGEVPLDFLRKIFYTLSPANTTICRPQRRDLLVRLEQSANARLGPRHYITIICSMLLQDGNMQELSDRALYRLKCVTESKLTDTHAASYKLAQSMATQLRRSGDFEKVERAISISQQVYLRIQKEHQPSSIQYRKAAFVYAQMLTSCGQHGDADKLHKEIVSEPSADIFTSCQRMPRCRRDSTSVYTMEAMAEYYADHGNTLAAIFWLRRAESIALGRWGSDSVTTLHISDKLEQLSQNVEQSGPERSLEELR